MPKKVAEKWGILRAYAPGYVIVRGKSMFTESYDAAKACVDAWNKEKEFKSQEGK